LVDAVSSLIRSGMLSYILKKHEADLQDLSAPLNPLLLQLLEIVGTHRLSPQDLLDMFRLCAKSPLLTGVLQNMVSPSTCLQPSITCRPSDALRSSLDDRRRSSNSIFARPDMAVSTRTLSGNAAGPQRPASRSCSGSGSITLARIVSLLLLPFFFFLS
jgi:hypothetical protein